MTKAVLGIIGGSGVYDLPGLTNAQSKVIESPWGKPSAPLVTGEIDGLPIVFLSRHDKGHRLSPSDIDYRANIDVLKRAARSRRSCLPAPSYIHRSIRRPARMRARARSSVPAVWRMSMAHPVSPRLRIHLAEAARVEGHPGRA
jgi:5'-methylthioadenosine phosphorylase